MTHFLNIISKVMSNIIGFSKFYEGKGTVNRLPNIPDIVTLVGSKGAANKPDIVEGEEKTINIDFCICNYADNTPIYICVAENLKEAIVDMVPITIRQKKDRDSYLIDNAVVLYVPYKLFNEVLDFDSVFNILRDMFYDILSMDKNMQYQPDMAIIRLCKSSKVKIPIYDVTMMLSVIGSMYLIMSQWFGSNGDILNPNDFLESFTSEEMTDEQKVSFAKLCKNYCNNFNNLITAASNGKLALKFMF